MASRTLQLFTITIPTGVTKAAPQTFPIAVGMATIDKIRWRVPPGPLGVMGFYLAMGHTQVLPQGQGNFIVADNESDEWELSGLPDEGEWQLVGYNLGAFPHSVYLWVYTSPLSTSQPSPGPSIIPAAALSSP